MIQKSNLYFKLKYWNTYLKVKILKDLNRFKNTSNHIIIINLCKNINNVIIRNAFRYTTITLFKS